MNYKKLIIAHEAFYTIEPRASYYDQYLKHKKPELWTNPELPIEEVDKLFDFIIHWDFHFKGVKEEFIEFYRDNFNSIKELNSVTLYNLDLENQQTIQKIKTVFSNCATCTEGGRYESTDASKILQTINPDLFVMWDQQIRKGILHNESKKYGHHYAGQFIPLMKKRLENTIESIIEERGGNPIEAIHYLEGACKGKSAAKLLDEYNYCVFTMRTEFVDFLRKHGIQDVEEFLTKDDIKIDAFKAKGSSGNEYSAFITLLNEVKNKGKIDAIERRRLEKEWRENPERRLDITERLVFMNK